jgi:DNA-binding HxlR family transcriptional regulator
VDTILDLRRFGGADAYLRDCPSRNVLDVLASKWTTLIVPTLKDGPRRFGELRRHLDGITQKSLTQSLRSLERDGLVTRTQYATIPPRVEYALTDLGQRAVELLDNMRLWAEAHYEDILSARASFDERATREPRPIS